VFRLNATGEAQYSLEPAFRRNTAAPVCSLEAAHNPEVARSNPAPATAKGAGNGAFCLFESIWGRGRPLAMKGGRKIASVDDDRSGRAKARPGRTVVFPPAGGRRAERTFYAVAVEDVMPRHAGQVFGFLPGVKTVLHERAASGSRSARASIWPCGGRRPDGLARHRFERQPRRTTHRVPYLVSLPHGFGPAAHATRKLPCMNEACGSQKKRYVPFLSLRV
jgi:hypothetical protein